MGALERVEAGRDRSAAGSRGRALQQRVDLVADLGGHPVVDELLELAVAGGENVIARVEALVVDPDGIA